MKSLKELIQEYAKAYEWRGWYSCRLESVEGDEDQERPLLKKLNECDRKIIRVATKINAIFGGPDL